MAKVLLLGMGPTASSALESLTEKFDVIGLVREAGSSSEFSDEVIELAQRLEVPVFSDVSIKGVKQIVIENNPDCTVVSSYNRVLPPELLARCRFVNVHYAPLPEYRGRANVNWAIINGEHDAAITIHVIAPGLDSGNVLFQQRVTIGPHDTVDDIYTVLNGIQREALGGTVADHVSGYEGEPQNDTLATYGCGRVSDDGEIDWSDPTKRIYALIRALTRLYPAYTYLDARRISIIRALPLENAPQYVGRIPGRVVGRSRESGHVDVLTGDGILRIYEVMTADSGVIPAATLIGSTRQTLGLRNSDLLARIELLEARLNQLGATDDGVAD